MRKTNWALVKRAGPHFRIDSGSIALLASGRAR
jgi:hypothetical protein